MNDIHTAANFILKIKSGCSRMFAGRSNDFTLAHECREVAMAVDNNEFMQHVKALRAAAKSSQKIAMTKTLPTEVGYYLYCSNKCALHVKAFYVDYINPINSGYGLRPTGDGWIYGDDISMMRGYWAKVEHEHFEFVDEDAMRSCL